MAEPSFSSPRGVLTGPTYRRDEILRAAAQLFATGGYTNTSVRDVAAASGILAGSLYHHFASKEAIAVELVENYHADLVRVVRNVGPVGADPVSALRLFGREIAMVSFQHRAALQIAMFDAPATASSSLKTVVHAEPASVDRCWRTLISAASAQGALRPGVDPRVLRYVLHRVTTQSPTMAWRWQGGIGPGEVADCITAIVFDGLASSPGAVPATSAASHVADELRVRWKAEVARRPAERTGVILEAARAQFALRGYEATTVRNIAEASGITASNLYRYFESKDSMIIEILGDFSDRLLDAYKQVIGSGAPVVETIDAILGVLDQAGRLFSAETEILRGYARLVRAGVADRYLQGAQVRFDMLAGVIVSGVRGGELNDLGLPELVATCLREIAWGPMPELLQVPQRRVREFHRNAVLSGAAVRRAGGSDPALPVAHRLRRGGQLGECREQVAVVQAAGGSPFPQRALDALGDRGVGRGVAAEQPRGEDDLAVEEVGLHRRGPGQALRRGVPGVLRPGGRPRPGLVPLAAGIGGQVGQAVTGGGQDVPRLGREQCRSTTRSTGATSTWPSSSPRRAPDRGTSSGPCHWSGARRPPGALALTVAACGGGSGAASSNAADTSTPKDGGNLTFLIQEFPTGWVSSESNISSYEGNLWGEITDNLVYVSSTGQVSPWIATSWQTEDNATKYILHLKPGVTFSDGSPLNAAAVVDNITLWAKGDPSRGIAKVGLFPALYFEKATALNSSTVEVDFSKPTLGFIPTLGYHGSILLSPKTLALPVNQQANLLNEIGSGPFVVKSYQTGVSYTLVRRADYNWGPAALGHTGPAYLDSITYKVVADESTREQAVVAGDAQVDFNVTPLDIPSLEAQGFTVGTLRYLGFVDGFEVDGGAGPTSSLQVRQALQHAINRTQIISTVYPKGWVAATSFIQSNVPGEVNDSALFNYDPTLSGQLLTQAGWVLGSNGYRQKDGQTLSFTLIPNPYVPSTQQEDELIAQQFEKIGIKAQLKIVPLADDASYADVSANYPLLSVSRSFIDFSTVGGVLTSLNGGENWFQVGPNVHGVAYNGVAYANFYTAWLS